MLRKLLDSMVRHPPDHVVPADAARGVIAYIAPVPELVAVGPDETPYSDGASMRLRVLAPARTLASLADVYLVPPAELERMDFSSLGEVRAVIVTKLTTDVILGQPNTVKAIVDWLEVHGSRYRAIADLSDDYAALAASARLPMLARYQEALAAHCALTVPCDALRQALEPSARHGVTVIEDPYERITAGAPRIPSNHRLHLCWFGNLGTSEVEEVGSALERVVARFPELPVRVDFVAHAQRTSLTEGIGARLRAAHARLAFRAIPWSREATWQAISDADLVLLPRPDTAWGRVKSHNRLVEVLRCGRLAIASPIPSYLELTDFAWVGEDLAEGVAWALANPTDAARRIAAGQTYIEQRFSPAAIGAKWAAAIGLAPPPRDDSQGTPSAS